MKKIVITLIKLYKASYPFREPLIRMFVSPESLECRFSPTCSEYTIRAIEKYGVAKGLFYGARRISRCHPGSKGGHDPVP